MIINDDDLFFPNNLLPSLIPLTIVCGPPAAGKTNFVRKTAQPDDLIIDLDDIIVRHFGPSAGRTDDWEIREQGLRIRNEMLAGLSVPSSRRAAWFITMAPRADTREHWRQMLRPIRIVVIKTPMHVCIARLAHDPMRKANVRTQGQVIRRWWRDYEPRPGDKVYETRFYQSAGLAAWAEQA